MPMEVHTITPGPYSDAGEAWKGDYPLLGVQKARQVDAGSNGGIGRHADLDAIDWTHHYDETQEKIGRAVPVTADPCLVSIDWENDESDVLWGPARDGVWYPGFLESVCRWQSFVRWLLPDMRRLFELAFYGSIVRCHPKYADNIRAACSAELDHLGEFDVLTPSAYNKTAGDLIGDIVSLEALMTNVAWLSEQLEHKPIIVQLRIHHAGRDGSLVELGEFERDLDVIDRWRSRCNLRGWCLWSFGTDPRTAAETSRAMVEDGYAEALQARL